MNELLMDHEKLDVYRLSIDYVAYSFSLATGSTGQNRHARDQWIRATQSIPLTIAEGNGKHSLKDRSRVFDIARVSDLECAAIHDVLSVCRAITPDENLIGKSKLRRIEAMLTKLVARNESVSETAATYQEKLEYEHDHEQDVP
jgi:four helix bundle protein